MQIIPLFSGLVNKHPQQRSRRHARGNGHAGALRGFLTGGEGFPEFFKQQRGQAHAVFELRHILIKRRLRNRAPGL